MDENFENSSEKLEELDWKMSVELPGKPESGKKLRQLIKLIEDGEPRASIKILRTQTSGYPYSIKTLEFTLGDATLSIHSKIEGAVKKIADLFIAERDKEGKLVEYANGGVVCKKANEASIEEEVKRLARNISPHDTPHYLVDAMQSMVEIEEDLNQ